MGGQKEKTCNPATVEYQLSRWRSVHQLIGTCKFKDIFAIYGTDEVQQLVDNGELEKVRHWVKTVKHGTLAEKSVDELRLLASRCHIRYYGKMSKTQLLVAITRRCTNGA